MIVFISGQIHSSTVMSPVAVMSLLSLWWRTQRRHFLSPYFIFRISTVVLCLSWSEMQYESNTGFYCCRHISLALCFALSFAVLFLFPIDLFWGRLIDLFFRLWSATDSDHKEVCSASFYLWRGVGTKVKRHFFLSPDWWRIIIALHSIKTTSPA